MTSFLSSLRKIPPAVVYLAIPIVGTAAFSWPFWIDTKGNAGHSADAWIWAALVSALAVGAVALELKRASMTAAGIAILGVLASMTGLLRIVDLPGGGSGMFFLLILAAAALGPRCGVLLAFAAMAAGGVITGGVGPWLPFQMLALAVVGAFAGLLGNLTSHLRPRAETMVLGFYGFIAAFAYGLVINLWDWPLRESSGSDIAFNSSLGFADTVGTYWRFYTATSLAWDGAGAIANSIIIVSVGTPVLLALRRVQHRISPSVYFVETTADATVTP